MRTFDQLTEEAQQRALQVLELIVAMVFHSEIESYVLNFLANNGLVGKVGYLTVDCEIRDSTSPVSVSISGEIDLENLEKYLDISLENLTGFVIENLEILLEFKIKPCYNPIAKLIENHVSQAFRQLNSILSKSYFQLISSPNLLKYSGNLCFAENGIPLVLEKRMSYSMKELRCAISENLRMIFGSCAILADIQLSKPEDFEKLKNLLDR